MQSKQISFVVLNLYQILLAVDLRWSMDRADRMRHVFFSGLEGLEGAIL